MSMERCRMAGAIICAVMSFFAVEADGVAQGQDKGETIQPGGTMSYGISGFLPAPYVATSPFAISFAPKFEVPSVSWDIIILRLNLLVGSHRAVYALDVGGLGNFADYKMDGIGIAGLFNSIGESDGAFHVAGIFNFASFDFAGCQISGIYSGTEGTHQGLQVGVGNYAGSLVGAQIGVVNYAERLKGVQIGLLNFNRSSPVAFLPIANAAF